VPVVVIITPERLRLAYNPASIRITTSIMPHAPVNTTPSSGHVIERTVELERYRAIAGGVFESYSVFILMILVRHFNGTAFDKSVIAAAGTSGLLLTPITLFFSRHLGYSAPRMLALLFGLSSVAFFLAVGATSASLFVTLLAIGIVLPSTASPLLTSIFHNNYPIQQRGQLYAQNQAIRIATSIIFGGVAGWALNGAIHYYYVLIALYGVALASSAYFLSQLPGDNSSTPRAPLLSCFRYLTHDELLRNTTISWMLLGFGNLMMLPLRTEYLANPIYGMRLSELEIALYVSILPNLARLGGTYVWGRLFDSMNFFSLRIILNLSFLTGIVSFFLSDASLMLALSALIFGFSTSGGDVAWTLWVTKFAPPERVADYMAVHTFFTGIRGLFAPMTAFALLGILDIRTLSLISAALILMASILLFSIREEAKDRHP
jgi:MFS family permease